VRCDNIIIVEVLMKSLEEINRIRNEKKEMRNEE